MFIILTTNYAEANRGGFLFRDESLHQDGKSYYPGGILYRTRDEAFTKIRELLERYRKTREAIRLLGESGGASFPFGNPFEDLPEPKFAVFELAEVLETDVSQLPKLDWSTGTDG